MADKAPCTPFTFFLHVADMPDSVGIGATPEAARDVLAADIRRDLAGTPDLDALVEETVTKAHPFTVEAATVEGVRVFVVGLLGTVRGGRVLAALGVL